MKTASIDTQRQYQESNIEKLKDVGEFIQYNVNKIDEDELIELVSDIDYLILGPSGIKYFSKKVFKSAKKLKVISMLSSGVDAIDLEAAKSAGVTITNAKGANSQSVAEHIFGLALNLSKKIQESHVQLKENKANFKHFEGLELFQKTLGIVGFGEIGTRVARIAAGFDMKVIYHKRNKVQTDLADYSELENLFTVSDLIVIAVPGNDSTAGIIDKALLSRMNKKTILVSISRESVIDEFAILELLGSGKVLGYGFDADINEAPNPEFYKYPNVVITPHTAFFTEDSQINVENTAVENIIKFHHRNPQNIII